ncbi:MotA/TolQ/ExbB proton channel family protein [Myxococcota bacterium]|nr:MotA/TolQ/ExbB proton channel family protein [Myxococcota bacterium]
MRAAGALTLIALAVAAPLAAHAEPSTLDRAYLKELAFLKAEKAELERRVAALDGETKSRIADATAQVSALESRLSALRKENGALEDQLRASTEKRPSFDDSAEANDAVQSAREALRAAKLSPPRIGDLAKASPADVEAPLLEVVDLLRAQVEQGSVTTSAPGDFFLANGRGTSGRVVRVGNVARYGVSDEGAGALAESKGRWKLLPDPAAEPARSLAAGTVPEVLAIYVKDASAEDGAGLAAPSEEGSHGLIATLMGLPIFEAEWVLYLLIVLSLISVAIMVERVLFYQRHSIDVDGVRVRLEDHLGRGDYAGAAKLLSEYDSLETNVVLYGLREHHRGPDAVEDLVRGAETRERARYSKYLGFLATVGSNSPFIGLFGTVLGIIRAFQDLSATMANAGGSVMAGISEALIATAVGLLVAIPAVIAYNTFNAKLKAVAGNGELLTRLLLSSLKTGEQPAVGA